MSDDRGWPRLRGAVFALTLLGTLVLPQVSGTVAANSSSARSTKECSDVVVMGARGSGEEPQGSTGNYLKVPHEGLGPEVFAVADKLQKLGKADGLKVERIAVEYPAIDRGYVVEKWAGVGGKTILKSMEEGASSLKETMADFGDCSTPPKFVLVGYSQGAGVVRLALDSLSGEDRSKVIAAVNIADPYFTGQNGKVIGGPNLKRVGLANATLQFPDDGWAGARSFHVCVKADAVCQALSVSAKDQVFDAVGRLLKGPLLAPVFDAASVKRAISVHLNAYKQQGMVNYTAQTVYDDTMKGLVKKGNGTPPKGPVVDTTVTGVGAALVIDDSGSMEWHDGGRRRVVASKALLAASNPTDGVGIVKFTASALELASFRRISTGRAELEKSLAGLTSAGDTNIGRGIAAGCSTLQSSPVKSNFGILLTDGDGNYDDEAKCFADRSWPLFIFGLGNDPDDELLTRIADSTGGDYRNLADVTDLVCQFQQVRNFVATGARGDCSTAVTVAPGKERAAKVSVPYGTDQVTFTHSFANDPVGMSVTTPRGQVFSGDETDGSAATRVNDAGYESLVVRGPEPGDWTVSALGPADAEGERSFNLSSVLVGEPRDIPEGQVRTTWPEPDLVRLDASKSTPTGALEYLWLKEDGTTLDGPTLDLGLADGQTADVGVLLTNSTGDTAVVDLLADGTPAPEPPEVTSAPPSEPVFPDPTEAGTPTGPASTTTASGGGVAPPQPTEPGSTDAGAPPSSPTDIDSSGTQVKRAETQAPQVSGARQQPDSSGPLAHTGVQIGILLAVATGLVLMGYVVRQLGRRPGSTDTGEPHARQSPGGPPSPPSIDW